MIHYRNRIPARRTGRDTRSDIRRTRYDSTPRRSGVIVSRAARRPHRKNLVEMARFFCFYQQDPLEGRRVSIAGTP